MVHIPSIADIHIQNTLPGPPIDIAPATPAIFPVPTVAASAVVAAWKGESAPSAISLFLKILPTVVFIIYPNFLICKNPVLILKNMPTPIRAIIAGTPHMNPLKAAFNFVIFSIIFPSQYII